jgi:hypothetical protein
MAFLANVHRTSQTFHYFVCFIWELVYEPSGFDNWARYSGTGSGNHPVHVGAGTMISDLWTGPPALVLESHLLLIHRLSD